MWSGIQAVFNWIGSAVSGIINWFVGGYETVRTSINTWFTGIVKRFRYKLKQTIIADMGIVTTWKTIERFSRKPSIRGLFGIPLSIIGGFLGGYLLAEIIDQFIPVPETTTIEIIPPLTITAPSIPTLSIPEAPAPATYPITPQPIPVTLTVERILYATIDREAHLIAKPISTTTRTIEADLARETILATKTASANIDSDITREFTVVMTITVEKTIDSDITREFTVVTAITVEEAIDADLDREVTTIEQYLIENTIDSDIVAEYGTNVLEVTTPIDSDVVAEYSIEAVARTATAITDDGVVETTTLETPNIIASE